MREAIKQVETGSTMTRHQHVVVRLCKALGRLGAGLNQSWRSQTQFFIGAVYTVIMLELPSIHTMRDETSWQFEGV